MATLFEDLSLKGIRPAHLNQLLEYIHHMESEGIYWGNKKQFMTRHEDLKDWIKSATEYAYQSHVRMPRK